MAILSNNLQPMSLLARALRYWHTLRYLRPVQFYGRVWFRLYLPRPNMSAVPSVRAVNSLWQRPAAKLLSLTGPTEFCLLNMRGRLEEAGWDAPEFDKLWRYHQHYFDDLNADEGERRTAWHHALIGDWIANNPPGRGTGWEPYPIAMRAVNWIKWAWAGNLLSPAVVQSLAVQVRWLYRRLEWHLLGNHIFANAKALVFAGLFFSGPEAEQWLIKGAAILRREIPEQILEDGGHFERSPMYHALILEDMLDLVNLLRAFRSELDREALVLLSECERCVPGMIKWLHAMTHPDGDIALFNDAAIALAPSGAELDRYAARLGFDESVTLSPLLHLTSSGYVRLTQGEAVLFADIAPVGPDYIPGHAHADTLSCEFSLGTQRVLVNGGTSVYGTGPERLRQRGTAAHNSVVVAGLDSSEMWGGFRVARRARPFDEKVSDEDGVLRASAAHDGYTRLSGRPIHRRQWKLAARRLWIEDRLSMLDYESVAFFHLHPDVTLEADDSGQGRLVLPSGRLIRWRAEGGMPRLEPGSWHPEFGRAIPNRHIVLPLRGGRSAFELSWD